MKNNKISDDNKRKKNTPTSTSPKIPSSKISKITSNKFDIVENQETPKNKNVDNDKDLKQTTLFTNKISDTLANNPRDISNSSNIDKQLLGRHVKSFVKACQMMTVKHGGILDVLVLRNEMKRIFTKITQQ